MTYFPLAVCRTLRVALLAGAIFASGAALSAEGGNPAAERIVSAGGTVTEILYALGAGDRIVAVDTTSLYPPEATEKPNVGYMRALSAEGIIAQQPDLILAEDGAGPADVLTVLKASEIPMVTVDTPPRGDAIPQKIRDVGAAVGLEDRANEIAEKVSADLAELAKEVAAISGERKRVLFVLSLSGGRVMAGGADTEAGAIIEMAGGINAGAAVSGYKPLTDEAVIAAAPDVVLTMERGGFKVEPDEVFSLPAFQTTPAAENRSLVSMDGLFLLGFGPRTPEAARDLAAVLYPDAVKP